MHNRQKTFICIQKYLLYKSLYLTEPLGFTAEFEKVIFISSFAAQCHILTHTAEGAAVKVAQMEHNKQ